MAFLDENSSHLQAIQELSMIPRIFIQQASPQASWWQRQGRALRKTASYYVMHMAVAVVVAWVITRNWQMALTISMIEPVVQAGAYFWHERWWAARGQSEPVAAPCCPA